MEDCGKISLMADIYNIPDLKRHEYKVATELQEKLIDDLKNRHDAESQRLLRHIALPDLSSSTDSPLHEIVERIKKLPTFSNFDVINIPEIVPASISFDLFDFASDHPARSHSDTYYVDDTNILRTHDTVFWHYYLKLPEIKKRITQKQPLGTVCYGKVYRKDEIDRLHSNIFHQMGSWFLIPDGQKLMSITDLKEVLAELVKAVFGPTIEFRFNTDIFPYTDPSLEMEIKTSNGDWIEVVGGGLPKKSVLKKMGVEGYNGWAFGFGIERLAIISMSLPDIRLLWSTDKRIKNQLVLGQKYVEVSKYPPVTRDISFVVSKDFEPNNYYELVRDVIDSQFIEEIKQLDRYEDVAKFGSGQVSYTYRIVYRHLDRTLTNEEVDKLHHQLEKKTISEFKASIR